jgi:glyoxylase-like metal-dependent hydrolase (beta-lactamase superfamily II)
MIKSFCGRLSSNVYLVCDGTEAMIIDCGCPVGEVKKEVENRGLNVKYIILSHGHYDHACFIEQYVNEFPEATLMCHRDEVQVLRDSEGNVSSLFGDPCVYNQEFSLLNDGDIISLGTLEFQVLATPGHTPGSICLLCKERGVLFTGDVLVKEGWGRTDFKYGNTGKMTLSLRRLLSLDPEIVFYSGHGPESKIKYELF